MPSHENNSYTAFIGNRRISNGALTTVVTDAKKVMDQERSAIISIFEDETSRKVELDWRGALSDVLKQLPSPLSGEEKKPGPGRPKLGVVSREISLLPKHWEWLSLQPGGASVALRKLVEEAKKKNYDVDKIRRSQEATHKFMSAMTGDLPGYEEALRALYARDLNRFQKQIASWPQDFQEHLHKISGPAFS